MYNFLYIYSVKDFLFCSLLNKNKKINWLCYYDADPDPNSGNKIHVLSFLHSS